MKSLYIIFICVACLTSCSSGSPDIVRIKGLTMGTSYHVQWLGDVNEKAVIQQRIEAILESVNQQMSTYRSDSELSIFNQSQPPYTQIISAEFASVIGQSLQIYQFTQGYFDISIGPLVNLWGFGPDNHPTKQPSMEVIEQVRDEIGLEAVTLNGFALSKNAVRYLDLSAIAKGFAVDQLADYLKGLGYANYLVEIGGEIRASGSKGVGLPWKIAIEAPDINERRVQKILTLSDVAVATSGDYRNFYEVDGKMYSHTIDPFTGSPVQHTLASVTILSSSCAEADALATAMLAMGHVRAKAFAEKHNLRAYLVMRDGDVFTEYLSPAFDGWLNP